MKIAYHLYQLIYKANYGTLGGFREGALLRITFDDGIIGYSDCHPLPELGDLLLKKQLLVLAEQQETPLLECSLRFARLDAEARYEHRSLFEGISIPISHQLIDFSANVEELRAEGITHFKLKVGAVPEIEIPIMKSWVEADNGILLRLDFNARLSRQKFLEYWKKMSLEVKRCIDFVEDPYPYNPVMWCEDQKMLDVAFAADHSAVRALSFPESANYHVHKPAVDKSPKMIDNKAQLVITSYLDHPLGQMCAAYTAAKLKSLYPNQISHCGLLTHKCFHEDPFIKSVHAVGPYLTPPDGTGFGFDTLLKEIQWQNL
ncbi:MAG: hypothetical protein H0T62_05535 [Parachlamydiaceae bacterium]|nr:hypothetical protein [Parachlamydiaceae bacterium]